MVLLFGQSAGGPAAPEVGEGFFYSCIFFFFLVLFLKCPVLQHLRAHGLPAACHSCSYTLDSDLIQSPLEKPSPVPAAASRLWHCDARLRTHAHAPVMVRRGAVTDAAGSRAACRPGALEAGPNDYGAIPRCVEGYGGRSWRCLLGNPLNRAGAEMLADPPQLILSLAPGLPSAPTPLCPSSAA